MKLKIVAAALAGCFTAGDDHGLAAPYAGEIMGFIAADRVAMPPTCATLFVGSSSFRVWDTLAEDMAPRTVINRGFGGSLMEHANRYFELIVAPYRPREIMLYEGDNDIWVGVSPETLAAQVAEFMDMKTEALGSTPVYFLSVKPSKLRFGDLPEQRRANVLIEAMAAERDDLVYVDVATPMLDEDGLPRDVFVLDGLHMTAEGYAIWTPIVRAALDAGAPVAAPGC